MLYIIRKKKFPFEISAHVGDKIQEIDWEDVREVQADGHELTRLQLMFPSLPRCSNPVVHFVGQDAQFIVANLSKKTL